MNETYDLQFNCLVIQFNGSNFLNDKKEITNFIERMFFFVSIIQGSYEIHANGTDVALCVCVILKFVIIISVFVF